MKKKHSRFIMNTISEHLFFITKANIKTNFGLCHRDGRYTSVV